MAKQTINLGTSANKGDGDPLRTAFDKVNDNFDEVYGLLGAEGGDTDDVVAPMLVHNDHTNITVTRDDAANKIIFSVDQAVTDLKGSVFADDSTLLVDGVAGYITGDVENGRVITGIVRSETDADLYVYASGTGIVVLAGQSDLSIGHTLGEIDIYGDVEFNGGTTAFQPSNSVDFNCPVDFTSATVTLPQFISLATLKTEVAASADFADFQARIAAL